MTKLCPVCSKEFKAIGNRKYCSESCRTKARDQRNLENPNTRYPQPSREVLNLRARIYYRYKKKETEISMFQN